MKSSLLFAVFLCLTFHSFGQYSRSFSTNEQGNRRLSSVFSIGGEITVISIRESSNDTLRILLIDIDENGETSNYRSHEYSPFDVSSFYSLSGVGVDNSGKVTLCVLNQNGTSNLNVNYIAIDPISGVFSNNFSINGQYRRGFTRTRAKGDSLITYFATTTGSLIQRVAKSMSNSGVSFEIAASATFASDMAQNYIPCDLIIDGNDEYISLTSRIIKRIGPSNFIETANSGFTNAPALTLKSSGELFVLNRFDGNFKVLDANLTTINSGSINTIEASTSCLIEIYALPNDAIRIWSAYIESKVIDVDASNSVISERESRAYPQDQLFLDGKQYLFGFSRDFISTIDFNADTLSNSRKAIALVLDDLSPTVEDFIEYDQVLSTDKIKFRTNHIGQSFQQDLHGNKGFEFIQNGVWRNLIYSSCSNIIGTLNNGDTLGSFISNNSYEATGPYCSPGNYSMEIMDKYNRGYYVTREMIEIHLVEITSGNPAYKMPFGIREWPAHGDVSLGQAANLADFVDQDGDGVYEPEMGDYPAIYGDQCLLNIFHQHPNTENSGAIETHQYYFTFDCDAEEAIENAVFVRTHNFSRENTIFNTYAGNYVDFDIGGAFDDYAGTNVELGMIYGYNGDQFDETTGGDTGFNDTIPAVGMLSLQGAKLDEDGLDNSPIPIFGGLTNGIGFGDLIADNEYYRMESSHIHTSSASGLNSLTSYYNAMLGLNPNGSMKTVNGVDMRHDYFGTSDPVFYSSFGVDHGNNHSETTFGNSGGDRRMSTASGPKTFNTVDTMVIINAFLVGVDTVNLSPNNSLIRLFEHGQVLRDFFAQNTSSCGNTFNPYVSSSTLSVEDEELQQILVYPNPANGQIQFKGIQGVASMKIIDLNGRIVLFESDLTNDTGIDISSLENAVYLISISDEAGAQTIRMIKQ